MNIYKYLILFAIFYIFLINYNHSPNTDMVIAFIFMIVVLFIDYAIIDMNKDDKDEKALLDEIFDD